MKAAGCVPTVALALALAGCGGSEGATKEDVAKAVADALASQSAAAAPSPTPSPLEPTLPPATASPAAAPAEDSATVNFVMPNFRGANLQDAQDKIQELGVFYSISHDLRGSRSQVIDSNWQVCQQSPRAGTRVRGSAESWEGKIDFGVVKLTESCP